MSKLQKVIDQVGWFGLLRLCFYPFTVLITTPIRLVQTLWASRVLADGRWGDYPHFTPHTAINSLFYWTAALNLYRFGRSGRSPYLGLGDFQLSKYFHYSLPSLYAYWGAGAVTLLVGMFGWWLSHLVWLYEGNTFWVLIVIGLTLISTTFYANTFALQNYNAIGWMFFPLGLYGLSTEQWLVAGLAWLAASFGSFTVVFLAGILSLLTAITEWTIDPIFAILPASLKLLAHFYPFLTSGNVVTSLQGIAKAIGMTDRGVKYKRASKHWKLSHIYYFVLYGQFIILFFFFQREIPVLLLLSVLVFLVNSKYARFADEQSMYMLILSVAQIVMIQTPNVWFLLLSYWLLVSPLPRWAGFPSMWNTLDVVPKLSPFSIKSLLEGMDEFLKPVKKGQRILMAFDNPKGVYEQIFDGYRVLLELPLYDAAKKQVHFIPDWWAVFELNYEGAPEFWGRDVDSILANIKKWDVKYVVVYQHNTTSLSSQFTKGEFKVVNTFSWCDYTEHMKGKEPYTSPTPQWWLLQHSPSNGTMIE